MGIKTFPVISWLVLDQSVDKAPNVQTSLLLEGPERTCTDYLKLSSMKRSILSYHTSLLGL